MSLKVTLRAVVEALPAMVQFAKKEMPAKAAYRASKLVRHMLNKNRKFLEERDALVRSMGKPVEGKPDEYIIPPENNAAAQQELDAMLDAEIELEGCAKVAWADLENMTLPPAVLADLEAFIEAPSA